MPPRRRSARPSSPRRRSRSRSRRRAPPRSPRTRRPRRRERRRTAQPPPRRADRASTQPRARHTSARRAPTTTTCTTQVDIASDCRLAKRVVRKSRVNPASAVHQLRHAQIDDDTRERQRLAPLEAVLATDEREHPVYGERRRLVEVLVEAEGQPRVRRPRDRVVSGRSSRTESVAAPAPRAPRSRAERPRRRPEPRARRPPRGAPRRPGSGGRASFRRRAPCSRCSRRRSAEARSSGCPARLAACR